MSAEPLLTPDRLAPLRALATHLGHNLRPAIVGFLVLTCITGCLFPLVLFGLGTALYPDQAAGSLVQRDGVVVGSAWIGQSFVGAGYFHPRPSAAGNGYDATASGGTNLAPSNAKLVAAVDQLARDFRAANGLAAGAEIPIDAVTNSGSGLDPHITPQSAALQVARVARARGLGEAAVRALVAQQTQGRQLGFLGQQRVSVLALNLALDHAAPLAAK